MCHTVILSAWNRHLLFTMTKLTKLQQALESTRLTVAHHEFAKKLTAHAFFKTHDRQTGEDMVQTTFMKTWRYLVKGGKIDVMKAFLYHILNNLIIDEYRKHKTASLDSLAENGFDPGDDDSEHMIHTLDGKAIVLLIQRLPEMYRKIMRMRFIQDLSLQEMSLITGQTRNTMAVQVHRGIAKLKILYALHQPIILS